MPALDLDFNLNLADGDSDDADLATCEAAVVTGVCPTITDADLAACEAALPTAPGWGCHSGIAC